MIVMKRAYESPETSDGYRVLVERLWPRGVKKDNARLDAWEKGIAPSDALRKWYEHDPAKWLEFQQRYERDPCNLQIKTQDHDCGHRDTDPEGNGFASRASGLDDVVFENGGVASAEF